MNKKNHTENTSPASDTFLADRIIPWVAADTWWSSEQASADKNLNPVYAPAFSDTPYSTKQDKVVLNKTTQMNEEFKNRANLFTWKKAQSEHCLQRLSERGLLWQYFS